jgi:putative ABC transport system permease protein
MESLLQDLRFGARILMRPPGVTVAVILVLALGIGANSAVYGIVDSVLLHPVHYSDPASLAFVWDRDAQGVLRSASAANFLDWRAQSKSFSEFAGWVATFFVTTGTDRPQQIACAIVANLLLTRLGARVTANFFRALGVKPLLGRTFLPNEDGIQNPAAAAQVAVISYQLWQQNLGADANVLGRTIGVNSIPYTIIGVMPADFQFWWRQHNIWVPVTINPQDRDYHYLVTVARLKAPRERAEAEMAVVARSLERAYPASNRGWTIQVDDFQDSLVSHTFRARLLLLFGAVGLVLLIACANVADLWLTGWVARDREVVLRI